MHADGDGLYLVVGKTGAKRWAFIFFWQGKRTEMGLGKLAALSLADAREAAEEARRLVAKGQNPIEVRNASRASTEVPTFGVVAEDYINSHASAFRNAKHVDQWRMTLSVQQDKDGKLLENGYCLTIRNKRVDLVSTEDVLAILAPLWLTKQETGARLRGRIERVLDAAKAKNHRTGENPARWRGHLDKLLAKRQKLARGHHKAMGYATVPDFMVKLRQGGGMGALALEFLILTVGRTGEVIGAKKPEFDLDKAVWTVPAERMKAGREHRVALSPRAVEIARACIENSASEYLFAANAHRPISNMTMTKALRTAGEVDATVHGFRSSFRDWVGEETSFPDNVAEAALAHVVGDETERAYRRGDALAKRKRLMDAWANYCLPETTKNVLPMKRSKAAAA